MKILIPLVFLLLAAGIAAASDPLDEIKTRMAGAECCRFEFISILESDVFDTVDSTRGTALIAADGRYRVNIGPDEYLKTPEMLYSYSGLQNQVTVEKVEGAITPDETISFITRLDDYYAIVERVKNREYSLTLRDTTAVDLPGAMTLFLSDPPHRLDRLEFLDLNDDRNRIVFLSSEYQSACAADAFEPRYPDSTDVIKL